MTLFLETPALLTMATLSLLASSSSVDGLSLPSYIKPCKVDDKLNECAILNGNAAIPTLVKGDPKYRIPVLDPFDIAELAVDSGGTSRSVQMNLTMTDLKVYGAKEAKFVESRMDLKKRHVEWDVEMPLLDIVGDYRVKGKFLILPIQGAGPGNIKMENLKGTFIFDYTLETRKGDEYMKLVNFDIRYTVSRLQVKLDNLFNGDKRLSDEMNRALNENWEELNREMGPPISQAIVVIFKQIVTNFANIVPYKDVFKF